MVQSTPHGEGDVRNHINKRYDGDEDGLIEDFDPNAQQEGIEDIVAALISAGANVSVDYDDPNNTLTIASPNEQIEDLVANFLSAGSNTSLNYDDANDTLTISATGGSEPTVAKIENTIGGTVQSDTWTTMGYNSIVLESDATVLDADTGPGSITIQEAGIYRIEARSRFPDDTDFSDGDPVRFRASDGQHGTMLWDDSEYSGTSPIVGDVSTIRYDPVETPATITAEVYQNNTQDNGISVDAAGLFNYIMVERVRSVP